MTKSYSSVTDIYIVVGHRIRTLRRSYGENGITQEALARTLGEPPATISRWERGTKRPGPQLHHLQALANFFHVPVSRMLPEAELTPDVKAMWSAMERVNKADTKKVRQYAQVTLAEATARVRKRWRSRHRGVLSDLK